MKIAIGALVRIKKAPVRPEVEGQNGFVKRIVGDPGGSLQLVYVVAPVTDPDRPVGCLEVEVEDGDVISTMGDLVRQLFRCPHYSPQQCEASAPEKIVA